VFARPDTMPREAFGNPDQPDRRSGQSQAGGSNQHDEHRVLVIYDHAGRMRNGRGQPYQFGAEMEAFKGQPKDEDEDANERRDIPQQQNIRQPAVYLPGRWGGRRCGMVVFIVLAILVLSFDIRDRGKKEDDGQDENSHSDSCVGDPECLRTSAPPGGVCAVEEQAAGDGAENPADTIAGLGGIDPRGGVAWGPQHGGVGVGNGFQKGQPGRHHAHAEEESPERGDLRRGNKPEASHGHQQQPGDDAAFIAQAGCQPASGDGHEKIAHPVGKLHPGRLGQAQMQFLLKMFVHYIYHPIAEAPQEEERTNETESEQNIPAIRQDEHALVIAFHGSGLIC